MGVRGEPGEIDGGGGGVRPKSCAATTTPGARPTVGSRPPRKPPPPPPPLGFQVACCHHVDGQAAVRTRLSRALQAGQRHAEESRQRARQNRRENRAQRLAVSLTFAVFSIVSRRNTLRSKLYICKAIWKAAETTKSESRLSSGVKSSCKGLLFQLDYKTIVSRI